MYTLYFSPGACSLGVHTVLNLLDLSPKLVSAGNVENFEQINPAKMVPVLKEGEHYFTEGAAIILHLLNKHENDLLPASGLARQQAIENLMIANATMHPAYGRLFFAGNNMQDGPAKDEFLRASTDAINGIWKTIEGKISDGPFLGGSSISPADIMLAVYSRWGEFFPVDIKIGVKARIMIDSVLQSDAFLTALQRETDEIKSNED